MTERSSTDRDRPMGQVSVSLASDSMFLGQSLPIEVRDSSLRLVAKTAGAGQLNLPVGLYEVSAVLGDGQRHSAFVDVKEGQPTPVELGPQASFATSGGAESREVELRAADGADLTVGSKVSRPTYTETAALVPDDEDASGLASLELLEVAGASVVDRRRTWVALQCDPTITAVPTAIVRVGEFRQSLSLPISPRTHTPSGDCVVRVERTSVGFHAQAWISPERRVANGLQNMLSTGYVLEAARLADEAVELLRYKYDDPAGAALGALLLHKAGVLARWESWVANLAGDFAWLPDGKVLLAQLRSSRGGARDEDLELLLQASEQRVLFAETYSLLIALLRNWPQERPRPEQTAAIERLASAGPDIDRDGICLAMWLSSDPAS